MTNKTQAIEENFENRDKLTLAQCMALRLEEGDAIKVVFANGSHDGILINTPAGPGDLWQVMTSVGVIAINPYSSHFHTMIRYNDDQPSSFTGG